MSDAAPAPSETNGADYQLLLPDQILSAVESVGLRCDGRLLALNSYENRVYQVGCEDGPPVIAKFYRPGRWSDAAILEEHDFTLELAANELPVLAPLVVGGATLHCVGPYRFALYPRQGGRPPQLDDASHLEQLGRLLAQVHNFGSLREFLHRRRLDCVRTSREASTYLMSAGFIPNDLQPAYASVAADAILSMNEGVTRCGETATLRLHGDAHPGNVLWFDDKPFLVDFDDAMMGPAIADLWMFLSGDRQEMQTGLVSLLEGYCEFRALPARELHLVEPLRTARMMSHSAWLARRWNDPAFPLAFPWFGTQRYWQDHVLALREQLALMQEGALAAPFE